MRSRFTVEDVSFKNARKQSEVWNEIDHDEEIEEEVKPPVSLTPEQVTSYFKQKIEKSHDSNEKRVYSQAISWIKELLEVKKEVILLREKEIARTMSEESWENNIDEETRY